MASLSAVLAIVRALALAGALLFAPQAHAAEADQAVAELQIKAVFLYKFGSYVDWPENTFPNAQSPLVIGVLGADALADEVAQVSVGRNVNGHPIVVRKLRRGASLAGLHILFVGRTEGVRSAEVFSAAKGQPMLTVADSEDGSEHGAMINFVLVDGKVRFDVATPAAERGNLKISGRLLAVARKVVAAPS